MKGRPSHKRRPRGRGADAPARTLEVTVDVLGAQGDGVARAELSGKTVALYIPGALAGERVRVRTRDKRGDGVVAELLDILEPSPHRVQPGCPHFERCGGCALQHLDRRIYGAWKRDRVIHALAQRGFADVCVDDAVLIGEGTRRRVTFTAHGSGKAARVGFNARARHDVVAVAACPLLAGPLNALIAPLGETLASVLKDGQRARVAATACDNGVDLLIEADGSPDLAAREALAALVRAGHAVRVAWRADTLAPEPIVQEQPPRIDLSGVAVELPPGAFPRPAVRANTPSATAFWTGSMARGGWRTCSVAWAVSPCRWRQRRWCRPGT
ncbi:MAG: class I SAM-dependent RNA methyltransferase [Alphaproteobacteria bacterium]|nr:class I SAM-dependent RNA methyltransferase [Alphaproteobacteria bacterium]